ncbi:hypothetical protein ACFX16_043037 [Malus domestica]
MENSIWLGGVAGTHKDFRSLSAKKGANPAVSWRVKTINRRYHHLHLATSSKIPFFWENSKPSPGRLRHDRDFLAGFSPLEASIRTGVSPDFRRYRSRIPTIQPSIVAQICCLTSPVQVKCIGCELWLKLELNRSCEIQNSLNLPAFFSRNRRDFSAARTGSPELNGSARPAVDGSFRSDPVRPVEPGSSGRTRFVRSNPVRPVGPGSSGRTRFVRSNPVRPVEPGSSGRTRFVQSDPVYFGRTRFVRSDPVRSSDLPVRPVRPALRPGSAAQNGSYGSSD